MLVVVYKDELFWKDYLWMSKLHPFNLLYGRDKGKGKKESSDIMWGIALLCDYDSPYKHLEWGERVKIVSEIYKVDIEDELIKECIDKYYFLQRDSVRRYLEEFDRKLDDRRNYMNGMGYSKENWEELDKMLISTDKIMLQRDKIIQMINKESVTKIRGELELSMMEKNELK